ncbi:MAG: cryptochrome/photolyase family protein [Deinococcota bacterium]
MSKTANDVKRHVLVLGDQLTREVGLLTAEQDPQTTSVLMIESVELASSMRHHKQKLVMTFASMRHFAAELEQDGYFVSYYQAAKSFTAGISQYLEEYPGVTLELLNPNDYGYTDMLHQAARDAGGDLKTHPNPLWLSDGELFTNWAKGKKELRLEYFYRTMRKRLNYLMDGDQPAGGTWNYDSDNRKTPKKDHTFPEKLTFERTKITGEVIDYVEATFPDHFGTTEAFNYPVTRQQALDALDHFCETRLRDFGPFEDALVQGEPQLYHSLLSAPLNTGLLTPHEVCETALKYAADGRRKIPLNSIEGFIRQMIGWREFMFQVYHYKMPEFKDANALGHARDLPDLFWTAETKMNCMRQTLDQLVQHAHNHHIQRLMVLGNFALLTGVNPQELLSWFTACYIDALDWVMVPNVIGMSQYADDTFTSKPYVASANYINKMSDYCTSCYYKHNKTTEANACPFNSLYWEFIDRHETRFSSNPRMNLTLGNWRKRSDDAKQKVRAKAKDVLALLEAAEL